MAAQFKDLKSKDGLGELNSYLKSNSYIDGWTPSSADIEVFDAVGSAPKDFEHALRWYNHIASFNKGERTNWPKAESSGVVQNGAMAAEGEEDDDIDLFGDSSDEDSRPVLDSLPGGVGRKWLKAIIQENKDEIYEMALEIAKIIGEELVAISKNQSDVLCASDLKKKLVHFDKCLRTVLVQYKQHLTLVTELPTAGQPLDVLSAVISALFDRFAIERDRIGENADSNEFAHRLCFYHLDNSVEHIIDAINQAECLTKQSGVFMESILKKLAQLLSENSKAITVQLYMKSIVLVHKMKSLFGTSQGIVDLTKSVGQFVAPKDAISLLSSVIEWQNDISCNSKKFTSFLLQSDLFSNEQCENLLDLLNDSMSMTANDSTEDLEKALFSHSLSDDDEIENGEANSVTNGNVETGDEDRLENVTDQNAEATGGERSVENDTVENREENREEIEEVPFATNSDAQVVDDGNIMEIENEVAPVEQQIESNMNPVVEIERLEVAVVTKVQTPRKKTTPKKHENTEKEQESGVAEQSQTNPVVQIVEEPTDVAIKSQIKTRGRQKKAEIVHEESTSEPVISPKSDRKTKSRGVGRKVRTAQTSTVGPVSKEAKKSRTVPSVKKSVEAESTPPLKMRLRSRTAKK